jgi:hypothetical protein
MDAATAPRSTLDELLARFTVMTPEEQATAVNQAKSIIAPTGKLPKWIPNPGPQTEAFFCRADILLYGGQAGGGKSNLLLGLALTEHRESLIMRRQFNALAALTRGLLKLHGSRDGFSQSPQPKLELPDRLVEFGACLNLGDEENYQGRPRDLFGADEAAQFLEIQIRYLMGWNRTTTPGQRVRTVLASNPPLNSEGEWLIKMFRPWLDLTHSKPAKAGELRWYVTDPDGDDMEVPDGKPYQFPGEAKATLPKSRTFIPAALADNPYLVNTGYQKELDAMVEPMRSAFRDGNFMIARKDQELQIIPTAWVREAQARWTPQRPPNLPMTAMGADIAQGGKDRSVVAPRYDWYYPELIVQPGRETPTGREIVAMVVPHRRDNATVVLDSGGGFAGGAYEILRENLDRKELILFKGAEQSSRRTKDKKFGFYNDRSAALWGFREALDPEQPDGSPIALPPDQELLAELTAPTYEYTARGLKAEDADDVAKRLGRSPDKAVAVILAWWAGAKLLHTGQSDFTDEKRHGRVPSRSRSGQQFSVQLRKPRAA